jgi:hypothetical protein
MNKLSRSPWIAFLIGALMAVGAGCSGETNATRDTERSPEGSTSAMSTPSTTKGSPTPTRAVSIGEPFAVDGMQVTIRSARYACIGVDLAPNTGAELCPANKAPTDIPLTIELAPVTMGTPGLENLKYWLEDSSGGRIDIAAAVANRRTGTQSTTFLLHSRSTDLRLLSANGDEVSLRQILAGL